MNKICRLIQANRLDDACRSLERHLAGHSDDAEARRLLARVLLREGQAASAFEQLRRVAEGAPDLPDLQYELGVVHLALGAIEPAIAAFRRELVTSPGHADARFNLAWALRRADRTDEALALLQDLVGERPDSVPAWFNLGNLLLAREDGPGAAAAYTAALARGGDRPDILVNLGHAHRLAGRLEDAVAAFRRARALAPDHVGAGDGLGNALTALGYAEEAVPVYHQVLASHPGEVRVMINCALALKSLMRLEAAGRLLHQALAVAPEAAEAWNALGTVGLAGNDLQTAARALSQAVALRPDFAEARSNLGIVLGLLGRNDEALAAFRIAHGLQPDDAAIHSNLLFHLLHLPDIPRDVVFAEHRRYGERQEALARPLPLPRPKPEDAERRLRIGYVSPDFCEHAVALFFEPVLLRHDRSLVETFCYHTGSRCDAVTERLRASADHWRTVAALPPDVAAALIRRDGIDILVDLAGHTAHNGLPIFARRPAPLQATWLGYPGTTGLTRIDFRFVEASAAGQAQADAFHTERLVCLHGAPALALPPSTPPLSPLPLFTTGQARFGSFNKPQKIGPAVIRTWARLLRELPGSTLLMVVPGGDQAEVRASTVEPFVAEGIAAGRIDVMPQVPVGPFLDLVATADIALDPFPYSGGSTTILTLLMGVPVICLDRPGLAVSASSGVIASLADTASWQQWGWRNLPLLDMIAVDEDDYVRAACRLARNPDGLAGLRATLRPLMLTSAILDEGWMACELEKTYRELWRQHVAGCRNG